MSYNVRGRVRGGGFFNGPPRGPPTFQGPGYRPQFHYNQSYQFDEEFHPRGGYQNRGHNQSTPFRHHTQRRQDTFTDRRNPGRGRFSNQDRTSQSETNTPRLDNLNNTATLPKDHIPDNTNPQGGDPLVHDPEEPAPENVNQDATSSTGPNSDIWGKRMMKSLLDYSNILPKDTFKKSLVEAAELADRQRGKDQAERDAAADQSLNNILESLQLEDERRKSTGRGSKDQLNPLAAEFSTQVNKTSRREEADLEDTPEDEDSGSRMKLLENLTQLVFDNYQDMGAVVARRAREMKRENYDILPDHLVGFNLRSFDNLREYDNYTCDVMRTVIANRMFVLEECKRKGLVDRNVLRDWSEAYNVLVPEWYRTSTDDLDPSETGQHNTDQNSGGRTGSSMSPDTDTNNRQRPQTGEINNNRTEGARVTFMEQAARSNINRTYTDNNGERQYMNTPGIDKHSTPNPNRDVRTQRDREDNVSKFNLSDIPSNGQATPWMQDTEATYNHFNIPKQYRKVDPRTSDGPMLSSTLGCNTGNQQTETNTSQGASMQNIMSVVPPGHLLDMFTPFDGSRYVEWKEVTQTLLGNLEPKLQAIWLKKLLSDEDDNLVPHIRHTDENAVDEIWLTLDKLFGCDVDQADFHMDKLQGWLRDGAQCHDYKSLLHFYNYLRTHYYGLVRLGADKVAMAESVVYGISPLLFGRSAKEVNRIKERRRPGEQFNMQTVFSRIEDHLRDLKSMEKDRDKLHAQDPDALLKSYSKQDLPYLRRGVFSSRGGHNTYSYNNNNKQNSSKGKYSGYQQHRSESKDNQKYYKSGSTDSWGGHKKYGDASNDYHQQNRGRSTEKKPYHNYHQKPPSLHDAVKMYLSAGNDSGSNMPIDNDNGPNEDQQEDHDTSAYDDEEPPADENGAWVYISSGNPGEHHARRRDQTPGPNRGRGSAAQSPVRYSKDRSVNSYDCTLCLKDDHQTEACRVHSAQQVYRLCHDRGLCMVCFLTGHLGPMCKVTDYCKDETCKTDLKHHKILCGKFRRD